MENRATLALGAAVIPDDHVVLWQPGFPVIQGPLQQYVGASHIVVVPMLDALPGLVGGRGMEMRHRHARSAVWQRSYTTGFPRPEANQRSIALFSREQTVQQRMSLVGAQSGFLGRPLDGLSCGRCTAFFQTLAHMSNDFSYQGHARLGGYAGTPRS